MCSKEVTKQKKIEEKMLFKKKVENGDRKIGKRKRDGVTGQKIPCSAHVLVSVLNLVCVLQGYMHVWFCMYVCDYGYV